MAKSEKQIAREKVLEAYLESKLALDKLTAEVQILKDEVVSVLMDAPERKSETANALFSLRRFATYEYSKKVTLKIEAMDADKEVLKIMKKDEEKSGEAELLSETYSPVVKLIK